MSSSAVIQVYYFFNLRLTIKLAIFDHCTMFSRQHSRTLSDSDGSAVDDGMIELEGGESEETVPKVKADMSSDKECGFKGGNEEAARDSVDVYEKDKVENLETGDLVIDLNDEYAEEVEESRGVEEKKRQNEDMLMEEVEKSSQKVNGLKVRDRNKIPEWLRRLSGLLINVFRC